MAATSTNVFRGDVGAAYVSIDKLSFDASYTTVREKHEEVGGRDARRIEVSGIVVGEDSLANIEGRLDAIMGAASDDGDDVALSLRAGRRLWVRRLKFEREVACAGLTGSFLLSLEARDPYEESVEETSVKWTVTASGATKKVTPAGDVFSLPAITLVAVGNIVNPSFGDGVRTLGYSGTVGNGQTLVLDAPRGKVTLDGTDVTPYASGCFPHLAPGGTTLTYADDPSSSHTASVTIAFRNRWW